MNLPGHFMAAPATVASLFASPQIMALDAQLAAPLMQMQLAGAPAPVAANLGTDGRAYPVMRGVAAISVRGILTPNNDMLAKYYGWTTYHGLAALAAELATADDVTAVALEVDSPGGMVLGVEAAAEALRALNAVKPVHALVNPMAASAAYWLASQARDITVTPGGIVGSIGVVVEASSYTGPSMLFGEQYYSMTSSHARAKCPDPATDEGRAEFVRMLDESEARFHGAVAAGRGIGMDQLKARLSVTDDPRDGGAVFYGQDGVARGLADRVETRAAFYDRQFATYGKAAAQTGTRTGSRAAIALAAAAAARAAI